MQQQQMLQQGPAGSGQQPPETEVQRIQSRLQRYGLTPDFEGYTEYALVARMIQDAIGEVQQQFQPVQQQLLLFTRHSYQQQPLLTTH
jgi:inactivated superfamily I helicase